MEERKNVKNAYDLPQPINMNCIPPASNKKFISNTVMAYSSFFLA